MARMARRERTSPGKILDEFFLEERKIDRKKFAQCVGISDIELSNILSGKMPISHELAKKISCELGTSVELWLNLQANHSAGNGER